MLAVLAVFLIYLLAIPVSIAIVVDGEMRIGAALFLPGAALRNAQPIRSGRKKRGKPPLSLIVRAGCAALKRLRPMEIRITGQLGLDDAAATALACGLFSALNALPRTHVSIQPDFSARRLILSGILSARAGNLILAALSGAGTILTGRKRTWKSIRSKA